MITEDYVSFETAKLLKEKGFDVPTEFVWYEHLPSQNAAYKGEINKQKLDYFYLDKDTEINSVYNNGEIPSYISGGVYSAPTLQMAMKWLREVHKIYMYVAHDSMGNTWFARIYDDYKTLSDVDNHSTYEEACEAAIKYCLENLI